MKSVIEQIENRISEVVLQKQRDLNLIDTNNSSTVLEPATPTVTFDAEAKEAAKNALINEIKNNWNKNFDKFYETVKIFSKIKN